MATGREIQQMNDAAAELRRLMDPAVAWAVEQEESFFASFTLNDAERAILKAIKTEKGRAEEWLTTWRQWAERGYSTSPDEPYPVAFYLRVGKDLASAFATYTKQQVIADAFVLGQTAVATVEDLGTGLQHAGNAAINVLDGAEDLTRALAAPWPTWVKVGLGLGAAGLAALAIHELAKKIPTLPALAGPSDGAA